MNWSNFPVLKRGIQIGILLIIGFSSMALDKTIANRTNFAIRETNRAVAAGRMTSAEKEVKDNSVYFIQKVVSVTSFVVLVGYDVYLFLMLIGDLYLVFRKEEDVTKEMFEYEENKEEIV
jgi:hypothetical protein